MCQRAWFISLGCLLIFSLSANAQHWELGGAAGFGKYRNASVTSPAGTADIGITTQAAGSVVIGEDLYRRLGGEFRYTFQAGDLQVKSGGQEGTFEGRSHAVHYDFLYHAARRGSRFRPFAAGGGGIKVYQGIGKEPAFQPLSQFALLTKRDQVEGMISFGGGVKFLLAKHAQVRFDFRDYATPAPDRVFTAAARGKIHGWLHDFVALGGMSFVF
jgi:Outer membrane protein beta-barrel domain